MENFGCRYLFETGTGSGDGLKYASFFRFEKLFSVEIHPQLAAAARRQVSGDSRIRILNEPSTQALKRILPDLDRNKPVLFWLDAHFPGADFGLASYEAETDATLRLPLQQELELIGQLRKSCRDVILIDDLRIYEDGTYEDGPMPEFAQTLPAALRNLAFLDRFLLSATHDLQKVYKDTGYLVLTPKGTAR